MRAKKWKIFWIRRNSSRANEVWRRIFEHLLQLINGCLEQNKIPKQWKKSYVISIYQKGSRKVLENYKESVSTVPSADYLPR
jgi:hypothetical protein